MKCSRIPYDRVSCHTIHCVNREEKIFRSLIFFFSSPSSSDRQKVVKGKGFSVMIVGCETFDIFLLRRETGFTLRTSEYLQ